MSLEETELVVSGFNPPEPRIVTHHIGDVTCILMVPDGCPVPHVALSVYARGTPNERANAVVDLGLADEPLSRREDTLWRERATHDWRATVFLLDGDEHARVTA